MPSSDKQLGFEKSNIKISGTHFPAALFTCTKCGEQLHIKYPDGKLNPEGLAKAAHKAGWTAHALLPSVTRCPDCKDKQTINDPDSELRKMEAKLAAQPHPINHFKPETALPVVALREPTPDQRALIRKTLEAHFDEDAGCYLDGYDDERVSQEAHVPRLVVERVRDAAYGPIRITEGQQRALQRTAVLKGQLDTLEQDTLQWCKSFSGDLAKLREELTAIAKLAKGAA